MTIIKHAGIIAWLLGIAIVIGLVIWSGIGPIAHAIANFLTSEDLARVKSCEKSPCTLFFLDRTRGQARRWCSMALCGNRAKQAAHRLRMKAELPNNA